MQKGNSHQLTREQHVILVASLRRFAAPDGLVEVHLRDGRTARIQLDNQLFCVERLWDQRAEAGYMKAIEDDFQALVDMLATGRIGPLSPEEHRRITQYWLLWYWRNHFIDSPLEDVRLNGIVGEQLTKDEKEILESQWAAFAVEGGKLPRRTLTGLRIQMAIDLGQNQLANKRWGVLRSPHLNLAIGDRPGGLMSITASPRLLLAADNPDGELTQLEALRANQAFISYSRSFVVVSRS